MNRRGKRWPEIGKFRTARWVDAPYRASSRDVHLAHRVALGSRGWGGFVVGHVHDCRRPLRARLGVMPSLSANGIDIAYDTMGAGPPLVLLHGASSSGKEDFAAQIPSLTKAFHLYVPDARGHARTRWDVADGFSQLQLVDDLEAFVDGLGLTTFHLAGFSMGAMTAMRFATRQANRLRTLILAGITPEREPRATIARRLMDPVRIERDDPRWAAELSARHDPVQGVGAWQRLLPAIAAEITIQPLLTPKDLHAHRSSRRWWCAATATRSCRWITPGAWPGRSLERDCWSSRTAPTRSWLVSRRCSIRPWPGSTGPRKAEARARAEEVSR